MTVYMYVTNDIYELSLAVADTQRELCRMLGYSESYFAETLCRYKDKCRFKAVKIEPGQFHLDKLSELIRKEFRNESEFMERMGISYGCLQRWKKGMEPYAAHIWKMADYFGVDVEYFFQS